MTMKRMTVATLQFSKKYIFKYFRCLICYREQASKISYLSLQLIIMSGWLGILLIRAKKICIVHFKVRPLKIVHHTIEDILIGMLLKKKNFPYLITTFNVEPVLILAYLVSKINNFFHFTLTMFFA